MGKNLDNRVFFFFCIEGYVHLLNYMGINEKLPMGLVHLTKEHIWFILDRKLPSLHLSFLLCTSLCIGTTENGICRTWMHDTRTLTNIVVLSESLSLAFSIWWNNRNSFDGFSRNIFQAYTGVFVFENDVLKIWKTAKSTKCMRSSCSKGPWLAEQFYCFWGVCSWTETQNVKQLSGFLL